MTVRTLLTKIGFKVDDKELKNAEKRASGFGKALKIGIGAAIVGIGALGIGAIKAAADMEMLTTQFEVMLGSSEKATEMMDKLKQFSASTPFSLEDLGKGSQNLLAFGVGAEDVIKRMRMLGDTAGGNSEKLQSLVLAYGKVSVKGKASMEEINMIAERGVPIIEALSKELGVNETAFFEMVSAGKVSSADVTAAFETMTSEGGIFFEGMKKQSETFVGLVSTMKDNFKLLLVDIGESFMPVMKEVVKIITQLTQGALKDFVNALANALVPILKLLMNLLEPILQALIPIINGLMAVFIPLVNIIATLLVPIIKLLIPFFEFFAEILKVVGEALTELQPIFEMIGQLISDLSPLFKELFIVMFPIIKKLIMLMIPIIKSFASIFVALMPILGLAVRLLTLLMPLFEVLVILLGPFVTAIEFVANAITMTIDAFIALGDTVVGFLEKIKKFLDIDEGETEHIIEVVNPDGTTTRIASDTKSGKVTNVNIKNKIGITSKGGVGTKSGSKKMMDEVARSVFSLEVQKILVSTGF